MMSEKRIYIDITQLVHWQGNLTGIPRVMSEIASRYSEVSEAVFVIWDPKAGCFFELDKASSIQMRGKGVVYKSSPNYFSRVVSKFAKKALVFNPESVLFVLWGEWSSDEYINEVLALKETKSIDLVNIVYDMLPIITPQFSGHSTEAMKKFYSAVVPKCSLVLCISKSTKKDLILWLRDQSLEVPPTKVFRLGDDFVAEYVSDSSEVNMPTGLPRKYILAVGTIEARKNHTLLYYTYKLAKEKGHKLPHLLIVGRQGWMATEIVAIMKSDPEVKDAITIIDDASDFLLNKLYEGCLFTVYPSFYEGWGLPVAESFMHGKVCATSNTSSLPEVGGRIAQYFSPYSADECMEAIQTLANMSARDLNKRAEQYKPISWQNTFNSVSKSVSEVLHES